MRKHKKIIAMILVASISTQITPSAFAGEMFDGYRTGSTARSWTDGGGGKYMYGGDISFRFKRNTTFKPALEISPPGIKAGCNGVSISGGFIHMLGLDELKEQLQSAGQGAMMGVVVGIVYSLPGIADAFDKVEKYVRMLQQILSQSCQGMSRLTKNWIDSQRDAAKKGTNVGIENPVGEVFEFMNSSFDNWHTALNNGDAKMNKKIEAYFDTNTSKSKAFSVAMAMPGCGQTCESAKKGSEADIKIFVDTNSTGEYFKETTLSNLKNIVKNEERFNALEFSIIFTGYYSTKKKPTPMTPEEAAAAITEQMRTGGAKPETPDYNRGLIFESNSGGSKIIQTLLYGEQNASVLKINNIAIYPFYLETKKGASVSSIQAGVLFGGKETGGGATYDYQWNGLVKEGTTYLRSVIIEGNDAAVTKMPSVIPNMKRYVRTLKTLYRSGGDEPYIMSLIDMLARKNAVMLLQSIVYEMQSTVSESEEDDPKFKEQVDGIYAELTRMNQADAGIADMIAIFDNLDRSHSLSITGGIKK